MQRGVLQALNPLSSRVAFSVNVREAKMCKRCAKMANFLNLNYWETVEDRWVHTAMYVHPCDIYRECPGG